MIIVDRKIFDIVFFALKNDIIWRPATTKFHFDAENAKAISKPGAECI